MMIEMMKYNSISKNNWCINKNMNNYMKNILIHKCKEL